MIPVSPDMPNAFNVPSNDQVGFFSSTAKERWILGGNRSGKTEAAVADCILFATGEHPVWSKRWKPPVKIRYCAPSYEDGIKNVIYRKFEEMVKRCDLRGDCMEKAWSEKDKTLYFKNGSRINFKSFEQRVNKFGGADLHAVYSDEHGEKKYYRENKARLSDYGGFFVSSMTPEEGSITWEKRHVKRQRKLEKKSFDMYKFSTYGNPHLSPEGVKEFEASIDDERVRKVKLLGDFSALAGLLYEDYDEDVHIIPYRDIPPHWYRVVALDPHLKKETAILWAAWSPEGDLFFYRAIKDKMTIPEIKKRVRVESAGERIRLFLGDEAMGGDGLNIFGEKSVIEQLKTGEDKLPIIGTNQGSTKAFESGVQKVRSMLKPDPISLKPSLYIMDSCAELQDEIEEYQFIPDSKADELTFRERVRQINDDLMDCLRYIVMAGPQGVGWIGSTDTNIESAINDKEW